jgi:hypothetical protein
MIAALAADVINPEPGLYGFTERVVMRDVHITGTALRAGSLH